ncbi:MAG: hypothetical protein JNG83_06850 [Opitutaceae bacterium]|nr:hypothetical protein [Opitutaceae bacterium]
MKSAMSFLLTGLLLLSGCASMPERVRDRFADVPPQTREFAGNPKEVAAAALQAFKRLDFLVTRSKPARIEAVSRINTSVAFADSRQLLVQVELAEGGPGHTSVALTLTEQVQSQSMGGTSQQAMREHGFYALYFATLQQVIDDQAAAAVSDKN